MKIRPSIKMVFVPKNEKWANIAKSFYLVYSLFCLVLYFIGISNLWAAKIVYYMWKLNPFGIISAAGLPYNCGYLGWCGYYGDFGAENLDHSGGSLKYSFHVLGFLLFVIGGCATMRALVLCLENLETALGIDFLSRAIERLLPAGGNSTSVEKNNKTKP